jgi:hypothetical protein
MLLTGDGSIGNEETYDNAAGFATYILNPINAIASDILAWCEFSITYTFSGLKRPGASYALNSLDCDSQIHHVKRLQEQKDKSSEGRSKDHKCPDDFESLSMSQPQYESCEMTELELEEKLRVLRIPKAQSTVATRGKGK